MSKKMVKWKIYFYLMLIIYCAILFNVLQKPEMSGFIDLFVSTFATVALFGFTYNVKMLTKEIWKTAFVTTVIGEAINGSIQLLKSHSIIVVFITFVLGLIVMLPVYYAFFQYAFKKYELWNLKKARK